MGRDATGYFDRQTASSGVRSPCRSRPAYDGVLSLPALFVCVPGRGIAGSCAPPLPPVFAALFGQLRLAFFALAPQPRLVPSNVQFRHQFPTELGDLSVEVAVAVAGKVVVAAVAVAAAAVVAVAVVFAAVAVGVEVE